MKALAYHYHMQIYSGAGEVLLLSERMSSNEHFGYLVVRLPNPHKGYLSLSKRGEALLTTFYFVTQSPFSTKIDWNKNDANLTTLQWLAFLNRPGCNALDVESGGLVTIVCDIYTMCCEWASLM